MAAGGRVLVKKVLYALTALGALGLTVERIGPNPIVPGKNLHVSWESEPNPPAFVFQHRAGRMKTELMLQVSVDQLLQWRAFIEGDPRQLQVQATHEDGVTTLRITGQDTLPGQTDFEWYRDDLRIVANSTRVSPAQPLELLYWELGPVDSQVDSMRWVTRRKRWFGASLTMLLLAAIGAIVASKPSQPTAVPVPHGAIKQHEALAVIINRVTIKVGRTTTSQKSDELETRQARDLLWEVLVREQRTVDAVKQVIPHLSTARKYQLVRLASLECVTQIKHFRFQLEDLSQDLKKKAKQLEDMQTAAS